MISEGRSACHKILPMVLGGGSCGYALNDGGDIRNATKTHFEGASIEAFTQRRAFRKVFADEAQKLLSDACPDVL